MATKNNIKESSEWVRTPLGDRFVFVQHIDSLTPDTAAAMTLEALTISGLSIGDTLTEYPAIVIVQQRVTFESAVPFACRLEHRYETPQYVLPSGPGDGPAQHTVRTQSVPRQTSKNPKDGADLIVSPPPQYSTYSAQVKTAMINEDLTMHEFTRVESSNPELRNKDHVNKVNSLAVGSVGPLQKAPRTLYCADITSQKRNETSDWLVTYRFIEKPELHTVEIKWEDGSPIEAYDAGSRKDVEPYKEVDHNALGLPWT